MFYNNKHVSYGSKHLVYCISEFQELLNQTGAFQFVFADE